MSKGKSLMVGITIAILTITWGAGQGGFNPMGPTDQQIMEMVK